MQLTIHPPHPDDVLQGDNEYTACYTTHSITRAYYWQATGQSAAAAAQACLDKINASRREVNSDCVPYIMGIIVDNNVFCHPAP
jgi:hypothetical protein